MKKALIFIIIAICLCVIVLAFGFNKANVSDTPNEPGITNPEEPTAAPAPVITEPKEPEVPEDAVEFYALVVEASGNQYTVEPWEGSDELKSADRITLTWKRPYHSWPLPVVGSCVLISYDGNIMETYPAQIGTVYKVELTSPPETPNDNNVGQDHHDIAAPTEAPETEAPETETETTENNND